MPTIADSVHCIVTYCESRCNVTMSSPLNPLNNMCVGVQSGGTMTYCSNKAGLATLGTYCSIWQAGSMQQSCCGMGLEQAEILNYVPRRLARISTFDQSNTTNQHAFLLCPCIKTVDIFLCSLKIFHMTKYAIVNFFL
jgi:hypothetical protein